MDDFFRWFRTELPPLKNSAFKFIHGDDTVSLNKEEQELFTKKCIKENCTTSLQFLRKGMCMNNGNDCSWYEFKSDGGVVSCNKDFSNAHLGNWKTDKISDIKVNRAKRFANMALNDECAKCDVLMYCKGGCPLDREDNGLSHDCYARKTLFKHNIDNGLDILHSLGGRT